MSTSTAQNPEMIHRALCPMYCWGPGKDDRKMQLGFMKGSSFSLHADGLTAGSFEAMQVIQRVWGLWPLA